MKHNKKEKFLCIRCHTEKEIKNFVRESKQFKSCNQCHDSPSKTLDKCFDIGFGILNLRWERKDGNANTVR